VFQVEPLAVPRSRTARAALVEQQEKADDNVAAFFQENMEWLDAQARERGVGMVLVTPVSRTDWKPSGSIHWKDLSDADLAEFDRLWEGVTRRRQTVRGGADPTREAQVSEADLAPLLAIDDTYADLLYLAGQTELRAARPQNAIARYREAEARQPASRCDRAPNRHADRVVALGDALGRDVVDLRRAFHDAARVPGLLSDGLFLDGLHFTPQGADLAADEIAKALAAGR